MVSEQSTSEPEEPEEPDEQEVLDGTILDVPEAEEALEGPVAPRSAMVPTGALERFLAEVRRYPALTDEDERGLARKAHGGDNAAARKLVVHNLRLVVAIAYEFRRAWTNVLDLIQEGSVGLSEAATRWDPERGARFGSYAAYWIRAYVLRFLLTHYRLVHAGNTRAGRRLFFQLERERQRLLSAGEEPSRERLASGLGVAPSDIDEVSQLLGSREMSLESPVGAEGRPLIEQVDGGAESPESATVRSETHQAIRALMEAFGESRSDPRERAVWFEHLLAESPTALSELGERYGVSKQRMGQMAIALKKAFREALVSRFGPEVELSWWSDSA